jgi:hypothetical protein
MSPLLRATIHRLGRHVDMPSLLAEMHQCKTVQACTELVLTDAYGESEEAMAWLTCIEEMFGRFDRVKLFGEEVTLRGFALANERSVVAICGRGKRRVRAALESVEFADLTPIETRWLKAWTQYSRAFA